MKIISLAFGHAESIPSKHTCDGENLSPPLTIAGVPDGAKSLVLIVEDPDAPSGDFTHWLVWNINPATSAVEEGAAPAGAVEGMTDFGRQGYGGPCPPSGEHRYFFKLFALDTTLAFSPLTQKKELVEAMRGHILSQVELMGRYSQVSA